MSGLRANVALEAGGVLVSKDIQIGINLETVLRAGRGLPTAVSPVPGAARTP